MRIASSKAITLIPLLIAGLAIIAGCNSGKKTTNPAPPANHSSHFHAVTIESFAYSPAALTIAVGDTVSWTNNDGAPHTVTSDSGSELGGTLNTGGTYQHMFMSAGSNPYHCTFHSSMHGSVTVQ